MCGEIELASSAFHGSLQEDFIMDTIELRAAAVRLVNLHGRFADCFGRREPREHALGYLRGLLLGTGRKSVEPMALMFGGTSPDQAEIEQSVALAWQRFLTSSPWEAQDVQRKIQAVFNEEFVRTAAGSPLGTVGVIDGSSFVKRGTESVGVQRQWCGRLGKKENCQVGVFLLGATPAGSILLDHQLYLPEEWAADAARRKKTRVPAEITFQTKPQIAAALLARSCVHFDWLTADAEFGRDGDLLDALEANHQRYLLEVPANTTVWPDEPMRQTPDEMVWQVSQLAQTLPATSWHVIQLREGANGPLVFEFARLRVWSVRHRHAGPRGWLLIRRSLAPQPEVKYYLSNAAVDVPLKTMALATGVWRFFSGLPNFVACRADLFHIGASSHGQSIPPSWVPGRVCGWPAGRRSCGWTRVVAWMPPDGNSPIESSEGRWNARLLRTSVPVCPRAQGGRDKHRLGARAVCLPAGRVLAEPAARSRGGPRQLFGPSPAEEIPRAHAGSRPETASAAKGLRHALQVRICPQPLGSARVLLSLCVGHSRTQSP
jgi:SRSO17 transposase